MNVVIFARVSTSDQDYDRQVSELSTFADANGWKVVKTIASKVSGMRSNSERQDIAELFEYVSANASETDKIIVTEISRLGRDTAEALDVLKFLRDHHVSLYIKNLGLETLMPDGSENHLSKFLCTILFEISHMERMQIVERLTSGRRRYLEMGGPIGRPKGMTMSPEQLLDRYQDIVRCLQKKKSIRDTARITGHSTSTVVKVRKTLKKLEEAKNKKREP